MKSAIRGIFQVEDDECNEWREYVLKYGQPKFATKKECESFVRKFCTQGSNPDYPELQHVFTMLVDLKQIETILLPKIAEYDERYPYQPPSLLSPDNRFGQGAGIKVMENVKERMNLPFHRETNRISTYNTLKYLFFHMRCGIYVMIRQRKVVMFVPFVNKNYCNNWGHLVQFDSKDGSMKEYYREKRNFYREENIIRNTNKWWANGNIICNEHCRPNVSPDESQFWGDQFLVQLRDMLEDSCSNRAIPDCEFFINKRDYPHLKSNLSEPYGFLFDRNDKNAEEDLDLQQFKFSSYAPIMSFYISKRFADIPFPCSEDWEAATGLVFPPSFSHSHCPKCQCGEAKSCKNEWECFCENQYHGVDKARDLFTESNFKNFYKPWEDKVNTAFFRGNGTGGGTSIETNQRLHLAHLSNTWKKDLQYNGKKPNDVPFLDAEVTGWNLRDKKLAGHPMTFLRKANFSFSAGKHHYVPIYDQSRYKYILYVEGHCAANRYAFLMRLGCVILKVESKCVADEMWYFPLLQPFVDHVPIKDDLSDLAEKIQWCRRNDDKCKKIAQKANEIYEQYLSRSGIHDYIEMICNRVAESFHPLMKEFKLRFSNIPPPTLQPPQHPCVGDRNEVARDCRKCREMKLDEENMRKKTKIGDSPRWHAHLSPLAGGNSPGREAQCRRCRKRLSKCNCQK